MRRAIPVVLLLAACADGKVSVDDTAVGDTDVVAGADADHDGVATPTDCDDGNPLVGPAQPERCNGVDDDCDGRTDADDAPVEGGSGPWFRDADVDGWGDDATLTYTCADPGQGWVLRGGDCDDADPNVRPDFGAGCTDLETDAQGGDTDADTDAGPRPLSRTWSTPLPLVELNSAYDDAQPTLTASRLRICFTSNRPGSVDGGYDLWCAVRASVADTFGPAVRQAAIATDVADLNPALSPDGTELVFVSSPAGHADLYRATWSAADGAYVDPVRLDGLDSGADDVQPSFSADGRTLLFSTSRDGTFAVWRADRASVGDAFVDPVAVTGLGAGPLYHAALAPDGGTLLFTVTRAWPGFTTGFLQQIWAADGAGTTFADPRPLVIEGWASRSATAPALTSDGSLLLHGPRWVRGVASADNDLWITTPKPGVPETRGVLPRTFEAEGPEYAGMHDVGHLTADGWASDPALDTVAGYLTVGPYTRELPAGDHVASFRLRVLATDTRDREAAAVAVYQGGVRTAHLSLPWPGFADTAFHAYELPFTSAEGDVVELRTYTSVVVGVELDRVDVR